MLKCRKVDSKLILYFIHMMQRIRFIYYMS